MPPLRTLIADDHSLFRQGLISLLRTRRDLVTVVGEASTGREAMLLTQRLQPDMVLMDINMPDGDGLHATACICQNWPQIRVVILTASESEQNLYEAVRLGATGYLLKSLDADELFDLLEGIQQGEVAFTRTMALRLLKGLVHPKVSTVTHEADEALLSERELDVLRLVAQGFSNPQIAGALHITVNTVKAHLKNILHKLRLANRTQAAAYAVQSGLVPPPTLNLDDGLNHPLG